MFTQSLLSEITSVKLNVEVDAKYLLKAVPSKFFLLWSLEKLLL